MLTLYSYWRSSAAYRVRIALNLKGLEHTIKPVSLLSDGGEQLSDDYRAINPTALVPSLVLADGTVLTQSLAIIEYLDDLRQQPLLLPSAPANRARVRAAALQVACEIHPLNNLRVVRYLRGPLGHSEIETATWARHWMRVGLEAFQASIDVDAKFCFGESPSLADICLVPQLYNARRWSLDMKGLERLVVVEQACVGLPAFAAAAPERQADAEHVI
jgi:maleylacetoacetate isomerase/maleylpyruvate isomerase